MNIIPRTSKQPDYNEKLVAAKCRIYIYLQAKMLQSIRIGFDNATTEHEAMAYIDTMRMLGYEDKALEMEVSLALSLEIEKTVSHDAE